MGRIKTTYIKRKSEEIFKKNNAKFTSDFNKNKKILSELVDISSKQLRNKIAGYIVHLVKLSKDMEVR